MDLDAGQQHRMLDVLIVDDDPLILELHRSYVQRIEGFRVVGEASSARQALDYLLATGKGDSDAAGDSHRPIDLVLLDLTMPEATGLDLLKHLRARGLDTQVLVITGVRESISVQRAVSLGVYQYLVKPFTFATFYERMMQFREFSLTRESTRDNSTQQDIDSLFAAFRPASRVQPVKGLSADTLRLVTETLRSNGACTAAEVAELVGMSRVAARRYLEHLLDTGSVSRVPRHGNQGRPQTEYRWR